MKGSVKRIEVIKLTAEGHNAQETGQKLGISSRTVEKYLEILRAAYEAKNTPHLIHIAHQQKIIE